MILYFSATGNCKYVATRIADSIDTITLSISECLNTDYFNFEDEIIGIVCPTYCWGLPSIVEDFLKKVNLNCKYLFFVATYGTTPGATGKATNKLLKDKKIDAYYCVRMPDTYTPIFDLSTQEKIDQYTVNTESEIQTIIESVKEKKIKRIMEHSVPLWINTLITKPMYENRYRPTKYFTVEDTCIGCRLCEKKCPVHAIKVVDGKPTWVKEKCVACLGCLHRCPKFAIQYKNKTKNHGQYTNPNVRI